MTAAFRTQLEDRLAQLSNRVERIEGHLRHTDNPVNADFADRATESRCLTKRTTTARPRPAPQPPRG